MPRPRSGALDDGQAGELAAHLNRSVNSPDATIGEGILSSFFHTSRRSECSTTSAPRYTFTR